MSASRQTKSRVSGGAEAQATTGTARGKLATVAPRSAKARLGNAARNAYALNAASRATTIMRAMSNRQRLEILSHLMNGEERSVGELEATLKTISQSSLSQHLGKLREEDIVKTRRQSQTIFYSLSDNGVRQVVRLLTDLYTDDPALPNKIRKL